MRSEGKALAPVDRNEEEQTGEPGGDLGGDDAGVAQEAEAQEDVDGEEEARAPKAARDPGQPTQAERDEHDLTHIPYRPWCWACVFGKAKSRPSLKICGGYSECRQARVRMDYGHLTEDVEDTSGEHGEEEVSKAGGSLTMLVMKESQHKSVWAYPVERKGAAEEWVSQQLIEDFETIGLQDENHIEVGSGTGGSGFAPRSGQPEEGALRHGTGAFSCRRV